MITEITNPEIIQRDLRERFEGALAEGLDMICDNYPGRRRVVIPIADNVFQERRSVEWYGPAALYSERKTKIDGIVKSLRQGLITRWTHKDPRLWNKKGPQNRADVKYLGEIGPAGDKVKSQNWPEHPMRVYYHSLPDVEILVKHPDFIDHTRRLAQHLEQNCEDVGDIEIQKGYLEEGLAN